MTLDDLEPLLTYWKDNPPAHVILRAVHMKPKRKSPREAAADNRGIEAELEASGLMKVNRPKRNG
jgi:hypothetical protein